MKWDSFSAFSCSTSCDENTKIDLKLQRWMAEMVVAFKQLPSVAVAFSAAQIPWFVLISPQSTARLSPMCALCKRRGMTVLLICTAHSAPVFYFSSLSFLFDLVTSVNLDEIYSSIMSLSWNCNRQMVLNCVFFDVQVPSMVTISGHYLIAWLLSTRPSHAEHRRKLSLVVSG